jgi:hypothetical protein
MEPSKQRDGVAPGSAASAGGDTPKLNIRCECRDEIAAVVERLRCWEKHYDDSIIYHAADLLERLSAERARVIEECAKIAETFNAYTSSVPGQYVQGNENARRGIAAAIRALGSPKP